MSENGRIDKPRTSWLPVISGRLVIVLAVLSIAILAVPFAPFGVMLVVDGIALLVAIADLILAPRPSRIEVERELPPMLTLDTTGTVTWTLANPTKRRRRVAISDELFPSLRAGRRGFHAWVPAGGRVYGATDFRPRRRGRFDIGTVVVRTYGPLRLMARQGRRRDVNTLRVYPPFRSRREAELRIEKARILEVGLRSARGRGGGTEFDQLREYNVDDDFRRIDWAATARANKPIVRTYRAERNQNVVLLLDSGRVMAGRVVSNTLWTQCSPWPPWHRAWVTAWASWLSTPPFVQRWRQIPAPNKRVVSPRQCTNSNRS
jgi:uncharacterized protein (DUF58 family)